MIFDTRPHIALAVSFLQDQTRGAKPRIGLILGSGFKDILNTMEIEHEIPYEEIPHFPTVSVKGHSGLMAFGKIGQVDLVVMQGRFHYYEGHDMRTIAFPIRVLRDLGIDLLFLTNAAGSVNLAYKPGDLMILSDHLNLSLRNPLAASDSTHFGPQFPDTSTTYAERYRACARELISDFDLTVQEGVYAFTTGPSYETPAEIRMARILGADAIGMSTFPEALAGHQAGLPVFGLSMIANYGSGISENPLHHDEILDTMNSIRSEASRFLHSIIQRFDAV